MTGTFHSVYNVTAGSNDLFSANYSPTAISVVPSLATLPILVVGTVSAPATGVLGQPITVSWTDANQGNAAATGTWVHRIYLYGSPSGGGPVLLGSVHFTGSVAAGQSVPLSATVDIPASPPGSFYVGVTADYFEQIAEASTARLNTTISSQATLIGGPALAVSNVTGAATWTLGNRPA